MKITHHLLPRFRWGGLALGLGMIAFGEARAAAGDAPVRVEPGSGPGISVMVRATGKPVQVPACRGVSWEVFDPAARTWNSLPTPACDAPAPPIAIDEKGWEFTLSPTALEQRADAGADRGAPRLVRVIVVVAEGCKPGLPVALAECRSYREIFGPQMMVYTWR